MRYSYQKSFNQKVINMAYKDIKSPNENIVEIMQALDRSKTNVYKDQDYLAQDEDVMMQVMELEFDLKPLGEHLCISIDQFPSVESLEDDEVKTLVEKILDTWAAYNYLADLPNGLPIRIAYKTLLSAWNEDVPRMPIGHFHFDFYDHDLEKYIL